MKLIKYGLLSFRISIQFLYRVIRLYSCTFRLKIENEDQWLEHIAAEEENFLWVSNEEAFLLMLNENMTPPATSLPQNNPHWEMIDAQVKPLISKFHFEYSSYVGVGALGTKGSKSKLISFEEKKPPPIP